VTEERPPGEEGSDRELTSGDPLGAAPEPDAAPPPPPWRRDPVPSPEHEQARQAFGAEPPPSPEEAFGSPERVSVPEPETLPRETLPPETLLPEPPAPRPPGSVPPPGWEGPAGYAGRPVPPGATLPPRPLGAPASAPEYALAGWWRRVFAYLIDAVVIGVVVTLIIVIITGAAGGVGFLGGDATGYGGIVAGLLFSTLIATGVALLYAPLYMARTNGQTLGKQAMSIRVVRASGAPVDFLWAVLREVIVKALVFAGLGSSVTFGIAWLADCLWPLWDRENRALHDLIVDSRVVRA
jgi:uncharacterized RDD family membrane protein YckC